jgi:putative ABC transport system permease protein
MRDAPRQDLYFPSEQQPPTQTTLFVRTSGEPLALAKAVQSAVKSAYSAVVFGQPQTLASIASESLRVTKLVMWLLTVFAAAALILAAVGIYGVMSYVVRQRSREIGTRMALGATRYDVLGMVMKQGVVIGVIGAAIGLIGGIAATRSLQSILFGVSSYDPLTLIGSALLLVATILVACYIPARRAASIDPARTLTEQ